MESVYGIEQAQAFNVTPEESGVQSRNDHVELVSRLRGRDNWCEKSDSSSATSFSYQRINVTVPLITSRPEAEMGATDS